MITDGQQTTDSGPYEHLDVASEKLKERGVEIYALGIGKDFEQAELKLMVSRQNNIFVAPSFDILVQKVAKIKEQICNSK